MCVYVRTTSGSAVRPGPWGDNPRLGLVRLPATSPSGDNHITPPVAVCAGPRQGELDGGGGAGPRKGERGGGGGGGGGGSVRQPLACMIRLGQSGLGWFPALTVITDTVVCALKNNSLPARLD